MQYFANGGSLNLNIHLCPDKALDGAIAGLSYSYTLARFKRVVRRLKNNYPTRKIIIGEIGYASVGYGMNDSTLNHERLVTDILSDTTFTSLDTVLFWRLLSHWLTDSNGQELICNEHQCGPGIENDLSFGFVPYHRGHYGLPATSNIRRHFLPFGFWWSK